MRVLFAPYLCKHLVLSVFDLSHSNRCVVVSHCCFNLRFPDNIWCGESFHVLICHLYIFFGEVSAKIFCPFFNQVVLFLFLSFKNSLCILDNSPSSDMSSANIFSQSLAYLLILLSFYSCLKCSSVLTFCDIGLVSSLPQQLISVDFVLALYL